LSSEHNLVIELIPGCKSRQLWSRKLCDRRKVESINSKAGKIAETGRDEGWNDTAPWLNAGDRTQKASHDCAMEDEASTEFLFTTVASARDESKIRLSLSVKVKQNARMQR